MDGTVLATGNDPTSEEDHDPGQAGDRQERRTMPLTIPG
jgi:hypothetical protein